jgi:hypothetical protein
MTVFYDSSSLLLARRAEANWTPDGDLDAARWQAAERARFDHDWAGKKHYPQSLTEVAALWTPSFLYVAFWATFTVLNVYEGEDPARERIGLWDRDVVEVFANPQPEKQLHYYEFEVAPNNQWVDLEIDKTRVPFGNAAWNSGFEHAVRVQASRHQWTCEMHIPVAGMGVREIAAGTRWRINFYRADGPGPDTQRRFLAWSPVPGGGGTFHWPQQFGQIEFHG